MVQDYYTLIITNIIFFFINGCPRAVTDRGFNTDSKFVNKVITTVLVLIFAVTNQLVQMD